MHDAHGRTINYMRLSITDRCNLRCRYCMPQDGVQMKGCAEILRYEDFLQIVEMAAELGIRKVRVTGGEPLVRKGVIGFLGQLSAIPGIEEIALTTNGLLLPGQVSALKEAGVRGVNVSLDSLNADTYAQITRGGDLRKVLAGLEEASAAGLKLKLNMVVMRGINDQEIRSFAELSLQRPWTVRFIEYMPTIRQKQWRQQLVSGRDILAELGQGHTLEPVSNDRYCGPAKVYRIPGARGTVGVITPMSEHFCSSCNRIRVNSTGQARGCLFNESSVDLRPCLNNPSQLRRSLQRIVSDKPSRHSFDEEIQGRRDLDMSNIGG